MKAGGEGGRDTETHDAALHKEIPVQNTVTKMDIMIVTQHCHRDTTASE